jgi:hypothetical protein
MPAQERKVVTAEDLPAGEIDFEDRKAGGLPEVRRELVTGQRKGDFLKRRCGHEDS